MRIFIFGIYDFGNIEEVIKNTKVVCKVIYVDLRCIVFCVVMIIVVVMMLQGKYFEKELNCFDVEVIIKDVYDYVCVIFEIVEQVMLYVYIKYCIC